MKGILAIILIVILFYNSNVKAQTTSASKYLVAQPVPDRTVYYITTDTGVYKPITWGLDLAWLSEGNIRRGIAFMGSDRVDIVRSSFTPTDSLINGELKTAELATLNERLRIIGFLGSNTQVVLNCDHPSVAAWYKGNAAHWAQLIDVTTKHHQDAGRTVVSVSPFNEPDYTATGQGTITDFYNIAGELRNNSRFNNIRISGGNTLNDDVALTWYNTLKARLDEGNTHQLAGTFSNYANFYKTVRTDGKHATNDELHNVMEAMVGVEYGLQTGIWWGTAEFARGEFVKASDGRRLGYAEHRTNWTAASVYRNTEGKIQAFGGTSERQAYTTTYRFVSKNKDVYYDGYGPQREYTMTLPGGTAYQTGQTNAERVVNVTWGDDIQPVINGKYVLVNRNSGKVLEVAGGSTSAGANVWQNNFTGATYQQWNVTPVDSRIGGDFSYFTFTAVHSAKAIDVYNWSLDNGGNLVVWDDAKGANQQWFLEYAGDGWFYIRSRHSAMCLEVANASTTAGANVQQWEKDGGTNQQWRFLPIDALIEFTPPSAPTNLVAAPNAESVRLDWTASPEADVTGYNVYRADSVNGTFNTIARNIAITSFVDNTTTDTSRYIYVVKAIDKSLNCSSYSNEVTANATGKKDLVMRLDFENGFADSSINLNHGAAYGSPVFALGKTGSKAVLLNGSTNFIQLPYCFAHQKEISMATWIYWNGGSTFQHLFDFGNSDVEYLFLTPSNASGKMRFAIMNGVSEQVLDGVTVPTAQWVHIAVTLGDTTRLYLNGAKVAETNAITIRPIDFKPILNYIGRSQKSNPMFNGYVDDFRVYNYVLTGTEISQLAGTLTEAINLSCNCPVEFSVWPSPANNMVHVNYPDADTGNKSILYLYDSTGRVVMRKAFRSTNIDLNVSEVKTGVYTLKWVNNQKTVSQKLLIKHE